MDATSTQMLAGVSVPDTPLVQQALQFARRDCEPYLFNHVVRSWLLAARIGQLGRIEHDAEVVAVGTLLHDISPSMNASMARATSRSKAPTWPGCWRLKVGLDQRRAQLILG